MNERLHIHKKADSSASNIVRSQFQSRPLIAQDQPQSQKPLTQTETENHEFQQQKFEATRLKLQAKHGTITPEGNEQLTVLQTKMSGLLQRRLKHASSFSRNFANIPISRPDAPSQQAVQTKLTIGKPGDKYEQEADRVASQVVNKINAPVSQQADQSQPIQREEVSEKEKELQMKPMLQLRSGKVGMTAAPEVEVSIQQARGGGQPLANSIRKPMEQAIGADFSRVKVHTDSQANQLNQSIQAKAFTTGQDVFFRQGEYNPGSKSGQKLLAHELTHVVQQNRLTNVASAKEVIQRAVGFEFEVTDYEVTNQNGERIPKKEVIQQGYQFSLQGEDKGTERSCIEFVTNPPGYETVEALRGSMTNMVTLAQQLREQQGRGNISMAGGRYLIQPNNFQAHVQASVGVPLSSLPKLYTLMEDREDDPSYRKPRVRGARSAYVARKEMNKEPSRELVGFLTLLNDYLLSGRGIEKKPLPKGLFKIMARTDFKTMFLSLPQEELEYFQSNLENWLVIVLAGQNLDPTKPAINQSFSYDDDFLLNPNKKGEKIGASRGHWLALMHQQDILCEDAHKLLESMGSLGSKTDQVTTWGGLQKEDAPIFELRNLRTPGTPDHWVDYALGVWNMVKQANDEPGYSEEYISYNFEQDDPDVRPSEDKLRNIRKLAEKCTDMDRVPGIAQ